MKIDFLSSSAHKLHGPKGVGFLYINNENVIQPLINGGGQERQMRAGTENVAGIVGFAKAFQDAVDHMQEHKDHMESVRSYFIQELKANFENRAFRPIFGRFSHIKYQNQKPMVPSFKLKV